MDSLLQQLPSMHFMGAFQRRFAEEPQIGASYVVTREDAEDNLTAAYATLVDVFPNVNTGNPTYVFEYQQAGGNPHDFARHIIRGDVYYSLYRA